MRRTHFTHFSHLQEWLWGLHKQEVGGIIGDEMGLGKTVQMAHFLGSLCFSGKLNLALLIVPSTLLAQWVQELKKWYPPFRIFLLHTSGGAMRAGWTREKILQRASMFSRGSRSGRSKACGGKLTAGTGAIVVTSYGGLTTHEQMVLRIPWDYCILDEGHKIRNPDAEVTLIAKRIPTVHRIILTGAPIQNSLRELWSLFDFIYPGRLGTLPDFEQQFALPIRSGSYLNASKMQTQMAYKCSLALRDLISSSILRRLKKNLQDVIKLPDKTEQILFCKLTSHQERLYRHFLSSDEVKSVLHGHMKSFRAINILRKVCNHPCLFELSKEQLKPVTKSEKSSMELLRKQARKKRREQIARNARIKAKIKSELKVEVKAEVGGVLYPTGATASGVEADINGENTAVGGSVEKLAGNGVDDSDGRAEHEDDDVNLEIFNRGEVISASQLSTVEWEQSGKMLILDQVLTLWKEQNHRVLLFSQTVQMLNIIEEYVKRKKLWKYFRMDGTTNIRRRQPMVDAFNKESDVFLFLLTTRVGGLGLNLIGADRVLIFDPDWNPSMDKQARERAWRIGQENDVTVYRLICSGTIEEKIYHRQIYKQQLTHKILSNPKQKRFFRSSELRDLFTYQAPGNTESLSTTNRTGQNVSLGETETGDIFLRGDVKRESICVPDQVDATQVSQHGSFG
jgi:DNA excision repair protein ERCC-6